MVMVGKRGQKGCVVDDSNPRIERGVPACDLRRAVGAAVVDDYIVPMLIRLASHAFNAFLYVVNGVVHRGDNADQGERSTVHFACSSWLGNKVTHGSAWRERVLPRTSLFVHRDSRK